MSTTNVTTRLAIDCSTTGLSLVLRVEGGKDYDFSSDAARSSDLLPTGIAGLFEESGTGAQHLSYIFVTVGPGSFTGIRLGLAAAEALKMVNKDIEIIGLPTLSALALQVIASHHPSGNFTLLLDAAGGQVYTQSFTLAGEPLTETACLPVAEIKATGTLYAPASLFLPAAPLTSLDAVHLFKLADNPAAHLPPAPVYLKPLTYKTVQ